MRMRPRTTPFVVVLLDRVARVDVALGARPRGGILQEE